MEYFGKSDVGMHRKINQDSFSCLSVWGGEGTLLVVCDGMGGHKAGEIASKKAIAAFCDKVVCNPCLSDTPSLQFSEVRYTLVNAANAANKIVYKMSSDFEELSGMGTTLVAGLIYNDTLYTLNVGDSRLYIISPQEIKQISHDHSFVQYLLDYEKITPEEAKNYPRKNVITRAIGINEKVDTDCFQTDISKLENSFILLCTDGLSNYADPKTISETIYKSTEQTEDGTSRVNLEKATGALIDIANAGGGADNITAVLAKIR